jgi:hypothetical protein
MMYQLRNKDPQKPAILPRVTDYLLHNFLRKLIMPVHLNTPPSTPTAKLAILSHQLASF